MESLRIKTHRAVLRGLGKLDLPQQYSLIIDGEVVSQGVCSPMHHEVEVGPHGRMHTLQLALTPEAPKSAPPTWANLTSRKDT